MIEPPSHKLSFQGWKAHNSHLRRDTDFVVHEFLRDAYPGHHVTKTDPEKSDLFGYAGAGHATVTNIYDHGHDANRSYSAPYSRLSAETGTISDEVHFGTSTYEWQDYEFIVYEIAYFEPSRGYQRTLFILAPFSDDLIEDGCHKKTDELLLVAGEWTRELHEEIWVFDNSSWNKNRTLYKAVQNSTWDDVILEPGMKNKLIQDVHGFFDSQEIYRKFKVPWKRGVILHGVPGNGKTISIKALINSLASRPQSVQSLYVKSLDSCQGAKWSIRSIFIQARRMAPCMLIFEDLDSLVGDKTRSYFLNEVDGLESNDGILMVGSTNHLHRLDSAITKRPSRFDRKYFFKLPGEEERIAYCQYWRAKFGESSDVDFPDEICPIIAKLTEGFSFAYLKELFITTLLTLARGGELEQEEAEDALDVSDTTSISEPVVVDSNVKTEEKDNESKEGQKDESTTEKSEPEEKATKRVVPEVGIPEALQSNLLLRIVQSQFKLLLEEMDNSIEEDEKVKKQSGGGVVPRIPMRRMQARVISANGD